MTDNVIYIDQIRKNRLDPIELHDAVLERIEESFPDGGLVVAYHDNKVTMSSTLGEDHKLVRDLLVIALDLLEDGDIA